MKVKSIGSNQTEVHKTDGTIVLFSYETPVACYIPGQGFFRTEQKFSVTTSKHINKWVSVNTPTKPQAFFDALI